MLNVKISRIICGPISMSLVPSYTSCGGLNISKLNYCLYSLEGWYNSGVVLDPQVKSVTVRDKFFHER